MGGSYESPDMAAANREAVYAQAETFPLLRQIEAASRLGRKIEYVNPQTGKLETADFTGMSDIDLSTQTARALAAAAPELTKAQLDLSREYGTQFAEQRRKELEATDPEKFRLYEQFMRDLGAQQAAGQKAIAAPEFERVQNMAPIEDTGAAAQIRGDLERQVASELAQAGTLPPGLQRAMEQSLRARGAASGNVLGNAAALREALGVSQAIQQSDLARRGQAMGLLQSGQSSSDVAARNAQQNFQNIMAAAGQRNTATQQGFAGRLTAQQQQEAIGQQQIANIQSALGLAPIVSQAAQLGGLQQGAAFSGQPQLLQGMQQAGPGQLLQLGSQFALQNAEQQFKASQANSPMAIMQGVTSSIGTLAKGASSMASAGLLCHVARLCIPDDWTSFYFWKELVAPAWFREAYNEHAEAVAGWLKDKPALQRVVARWMRSKIAGMLSK